MIKQTNGVAQAASANVPAAPPVWSTTAIDCGRVRLQHTNPNESCSPSGTIGSLSYSWKINSYLFVGLFAGLFGVVVRNSSDNVNIGVPSGFGDCGSGCTGYSGPNSTHGVVIVREQISVLGLLLDVGFNSGDKFQVEVMTNAQCGPSDPTVTTEQVLSFTY